MVVYRQTEVEEGNSTKLATVTSFLGMATPQQDGAAAHLVETSSADGTEALPAAWGNFLHAFALPTELLQVLKVRLSPSSSADNDTSGLPSRTSDETLNKNEGVGAGGEGGLTCQVCDARFAVLEDQRSHFRTDWHRFNVKRHLQRSSRSAPSTSSTTRSAGPVAVGEEEFSKMVQELELEDGDDDDDGISSGSESSGSGSQGSDQEEDKTVSRLLRLHRRRYDLSTDFASDASDDGDEEGGTKNATHRSPIVWLTATPLLSKNVQLGIYRCVLPQAGIPKRLVIRGADEDGKGAVEELRALQNGVETVQHPSQGKASEGGGGEGEGEGDDVVAPHWTVLMLGGGHFAGAVVSLRPKLRHIGKHKAPEKELVVLAHKTFHRYTSTSSPMLHLSSFPLRLLI